MPYQLIHYCGECALKKQLSDGRLGCRVFFKIRNPSDYCSEFQKEAEICAICGEPIPNKHVIIVDNHTIHDACKDKLDKCTSCRQGDICEFMTNPSKIPKFVQKTVRQGNTFAVTQIMNSERMKITCQGCPCFLPDFSCSKQIYGTCQQYCMGRG